jgi:hypothetical protein
LIVYPKAVPTFEAWNKEITPLCLDDSQVAYRQKLKEVISLLRPSFFRVLNLKMLPANNVKQSVVSG